MGIDGEPVKIYQFIEVYAYEDDMDGDGVVNNGDSCQFTPYVYDADGKDICGRQGNTHLNTLERIAANNFQDNTTNDNLAVVSSKNGQNTQEDSAGLLRENGWIEMLAVAVGAIFVIVVTIISITWRRIHAKPSATN